MPFGWTINPYRGCSHACVYCFARPTHTYLDLDCGQRLRQRDHRQGERGRGAAPRAGEAELGSPSGRARHQHRPVPARRGPVRPDARHHRRARRLGHAVQHPHQGVAAPARPRPAGRGVSKRVPVDLAMSIAVYDDELQQSVEPGTPTTKARLATVTAVREHGLDCAVFLMPILPYLTDTRAHLDEALRQAKEAGATSVLYTALHLKPGVKEWFYLWLEREHPELLPRLPADVRRAARTHPRSTGAGWPAKIKPLIRAHGLERGRGGSATPGGVRSTALGTLRDEEGERRVTVGAGVRPRPGRIADEVGCALRGHRCWGCSRRCSDGEAAATR